MSFTGIQLLCFFSETGSLCVSALMAEMALKEKLNKTIPFPYNQVLHSSSSSSYPQFNAPRGLLKDIQEEEFQEESFGKGTLSPGY